MAQNQNSDESLKHCAGCDNWLCKTEFSRNRTRYDGLQTICRRCQSIYHAQHYRTSDKKRPKCGIRKKQKREELIAWLVENGTTLVCDTCGEDHPAVIDFHHEDPSEKEFSISVAIRKNYSLRRIVLEIKKCRMLCSNCHRKLHWEERGNEGTTHDFQEQPTKRIA